MLLEDLRLPEKFDWWNAKAALEEWVFKLINSGSFVKPGTVTLFAGTVPDDWVALDGASYEHTKYPDLYTAIGTTYGGTATEFNVPPDPGTAPASMTWMIKT